MTMTAASLRCMRELLTAHAVATSTSETSGVGDAERIDRIRVLEELKAAAAAAQAVETAAFERSQRAMQAASGVPAERRGRGIAAQIGFAKRVSTSQAEKFVSWAKVAPAELPAAFAQLAAGRVSEWRAIIMARETGCLSREDRAAVDAELAPELEGLNDRQIAAEARRAAYRLDAQAVVDRARKAPTERHVTVRPAPDTMAWFSALLPVSQAVACYAHLRCAAPPTPLAPPGSRRVRGRSWPTPWSNG